MNEVEDWGTWKVVAWAMVTWSPCLPDPECLGEETVPLISYPRLVLNLAPMAAVHPLGSRMNKLALQTQSSSVPVVPERGRGGGCDPAEGAWQTY